MNHAPLREVAELLRDRYPDATTIEVYRELDGESVMLMFYADAWHTETSNLTFSFAASVTSMGKTIATYHGRNLDELTRNILDGSPVPSRSRA